ncbi:MAG TPA: peroxiredoxin [Gammaproteobacteria bacterium]|mgnify:CR=1 FL=1|jgi:peroxiredoxin|nr:peroxiredoxin [Acidiferrobacteraceae bacterium]MDP6398279.1 peroxiredoxin [Arenicellales bacterium]MDP6552116.1 peroxiredoxin [Arenicellales bacterium]MDP6918062.1 peroxiredoxin [Arenicellales bacterium]HCX86835.1 peroxiredoxin [Gammaproteobacteria bacterium]|tara:strand:+ start:239 stop:721 length:483 start_codon:yes stop_codon:yes gene_type:complete
MTIAVGDSIPDVTVHIMGESAPEPRNSGALFAGRKVVLFALPGAFTPTCSAKHLPGFIDAAAEFFEKGVDEIICLSVNDAWVMDAWGKAQGADGKLTMVADGNGDLSRAMGLTADMSGAGFGERSVRYAMIVDNGVVTHLNVEEPRKFKISDAQTMLTLL